MVSLLSAVSGVIIRQSIGHSVGCFVSDCLHNPTDQEAQVTEILVEDFYRLVGHSLCGNTIVMYASTKELCWLILISVCCDLH